MSQRPDIRCYDYVNRPYDQVSEALVLDAVGIFQRATGAATSRAASLVSNLKVSIGGLEVGKNVRVRVTKVDRDAHVPSRLGPKATRLELEWQAETDRSLFPCMRAELTVYPLSSSDTQIELHGTYEPPAGLLGDAADRLVGHRIAEASVHRFVRDIAEELARELG